MRHLSQLRPLRAQQTDCARCCCCCLRLWLRAAVQAGSHSLRATERERESSQRGALSSESTHDERSSSRGSRSARCCRCCCCWLCAALRALWPIVEAPVGSRTGSQRTREASQPGDGSGPATARSARCVTAHRPNCCASPSSSWLAAAPSRNSTQRAPVEGVAANPVAVCLSRGSLTA